MPHDSCVTTYMNKALWRVAPLAVFLGERLARVHAARSPHRIRIAWRSKPRCIAG